MAKDLVLTVRSADSVMKYLQYGTTFTESQLPHTIKKLSELRLTIPCLSSGCCLKFADKEEENCQEITQYILLASKLGTPYVQS